MSSSIGETFKSLKLTGSSPSEDEQIYKVSYEFLKQKKFNDEQAFRNCLVSLINLDKYELADQLIKKIPSSLVEPLILEIAYVYYKIGRALEIYKLHEEYSLKISSSPAVARGFAHILIQTYYKAGEFAKALELNRKIAGDVFANPEEHGDLVTNESAIVSQLIFQSGHEQPMDTSTNTELDETNYDLLFNEALIELAKANLSKSLTLLQKAHQVCTQNNMDEEEAEVELLPIKLTISYVQQLSGNTEEAEKILLLVNTDQVHDSLLKLIVNTNLHSFEKDATSKQSNPNLIERQLNLQERLQQLKQKLTIFQCETILQNSMLLRYATGTLNNSLLLKSSFIQPYNLVTLAYQVLISNGISFESLSDHTQLKSVGKKLVRFIKQEEEKEKIGKNTDSGNINDNNNDNNNDKKDNSINYNSSGVVEAVTILLVFVNSQLNNFDQSLPLLEKLANESLNEMIVKPGIVGTLITVYEKQHNLAKLKKLLKTLVEKLLYSPEDSFKNANYYNFAKIVAMKNYAFSEDSRQLFEFLHAANPQDMLINSILSNSNESLQSVADLSSQKSVDSLLAVNMEALIPTKSKPIKSITKAATKVTKKKQKPKFGKNKVVKPEGEFTLDKERWLPLKLRSYYKPTKKDKKKAGGHQGAVESFSPSTTPAPSSASTSHTNQNANPNANAQGASHGGSSSASKNKKKKKGKK